jgi:ERCC4-type nuclease
MLIKIDNREKDLYKELKGVSANITIELQQLDIGDIIICDDLGNEKIIIERKTIDDLIASIKDGRYAEQSFRLNECELHNHNIIYLIEGDLDKINSYSNKRFNKDTVISSFVTITYFKGFSLLRTKSVTETAKIIVQYANKLGKEQNKDKTGFYDKDAGGEVKDYASVVKRAKKSNITEDNIGVIMLSQIPGVSYASASKIMEKFGTIKKLMKCVDEDPVCLDEIKIEMKNGKGNRRISKTAVANIKKYLLQ